MPRGGLLPLREKVPEGRMRGVELSKSIEAWDDAEPLTRFSAERGKPPSPSRERERGPYLLTPPVLAAFSASHHQIVGNPLEKSGRFSGWLKRFQWAMRELRRE